MIVDLSSEFEFLINQKASSLCNLFKVSTEGTLFLKNEDLSSLDFLKNLLQEKSYNDVINFIVFSLPLHTALQWSYDCLVTLPNVPEESAGLETLISKWLENPTPETRESIYQCAEIINFSTPWGFLGTAVF
jgi:hypothetical protein